jgi:hypothetical protein
MTLLYILRDYFEGGFIKRADQIGERELKRVNHVYVYSFQAPIRQNRDNAPVLQFAGAYNLIWHGANTESLQYILLYYLKIVGPYSDQRRQFVALFTFA